MISTRELEEILGIALKGGGDFAEIFIERSKGTSVICEDGKIERVTSGIDGGAGIRVILGDTTSYACTTDTSFSSLKNTAEAASRSFSSNKKIPGFSLKPQISTLSYPIKLRPDEVPIERKTGIVLEANKIARSYGDKIIQVTVSYGDSNQAVTIANSEGTYIEDNRIRTRFVINVIAAKDGVLQTGYEGPGGSCGFELFEKHPVEKISRLAAERALKMLDAPPAPSGKMPVVLSSQAGGTMIHEACGHALEADFVMKGTSIFGEKLGGKVASDLITVIDDATLPGNFGSFRFDDEGTPSQKTILIEKGILKGFMCDKYTAKRINMTSTGNGRRQSFRTKPVPRMTNTFIAQGKMDPEEIITSIKNGLLVKKMGGGEVDVVNGDFVFDILEGYLIEDGKIKHPVRGAILTGNGPKILETIDMVGNDLEFTPGVCGKYDHAPVSDAQPTIRIPEIIVGGRM
ncbi:MAG: TldD/PmbA family protein [Candidatus Saganbacteria bacterium]|nr:TldD/PmbA family protein [Candidatus Saganbacteria bacterium]